MSRVTLITGASSGIGEATAHALLKQGDVVYAAARRVDRMADLETAGAHPIKMDITVEEDVTAAVARILDEQGRIDVLINNAGYGSYGAIEDVPMEEARRQFEVNIFGLARLTQLVVPHMRERRAGMVINVSSVGGKIYTPFGGWYHATKHALEGWSDCLRWELAPFGVQVVVIEPGAIATEWDGIASSGLLKTSGEGAYREMAQKVGRMMDVGSSQGSKPTVISDLVLKALRARRPKPRYAAGYMARPILTLRRILSDRGFDGLLHRMVAYYAK